jgi:putative transposase
MSFVKIWIHLVWATKNREPFFETRAQRLILHERLRDYGQSLGIDVDFVSGYTDHIHLLLRLKSTQTVAECVRLLKGDSSYWLRAEKHVPAYFGWQNGYFAVSVSESGLNMVRQYIDNQEAHHLSQTSADEWAAMLRRWGFDEADGESLG